MSFELDDVVLDEKETSNELKSPEDYSRFCRSRFLESENRKNHMA